MHDQNQGKAKITEPCGQLYSNTTAREKPKFVSDKWNMIHGTLHDTVNMSFMHDSVGLCYKTMFLLQAEKILLLIDYYSRHCAADGLAPLGARTSAATVMTNNNTIYISKSLRHYWRPQSYIGQFLILMKWSGRTRPWHSTHPCPKYPGDLICIFA